VPPLTQPILSVMSLVDQARDKKRRRITRACDYCHQRSIRCPYGTSSSCQNCLDFQQPCTYQRTARKRGGPHASRSPVSTSEASDNTKSASQARPYSMCCQKQASLFHSTSTDEHCILRTVNYQYTTFLVLLTSCNKTVLLTLSLPPDPGRPITPQVRQS